MASTSPQHPESLQLVSKAIGPLPLLNRFLERLKIEHFFAELVPAGDRRQRLAPAVGLGVLLRNILIARQPLYGLAEPGQPYPFNTYPYWALGLLLLSVAYGLVLARSAPDLVQRLGSYVADEEQ